MGMQTKEDNSYQRRFSPAFAVCLAVLVAVFIYMFFSELLNQNMSFSNGYMAVEYNEGWQYVLPDGNITPAKIPGKLKTGDEPVTIENIVPDDALAGDYIAVRADRQDIDIYINDVLRKSCPNVGKTYVLVKIFPEDCGEKIAIRFTNHSVTERIPVYDIYYGEEAGVWRMIARDSGGRMCGAVVTFFSAAFLLLASVYLSIRDHMLSDLSFLALSGLAFGTWNILSNILPQSVGLDSIVSYDASYYTACFMQAPLIVYIARCRRGRFDVILSRILWFDLISGALLSLLNITGIATFMVTWPVVAVIQVIVAVMVALLFDPNEFRYHMKDQWIIFTGFMFFSVGNILEVLRVLFFQFRWLAGVSAYGMCALIIFAVINTLIGYSKSRSERDTALRLKEIRSSFLAAMSHEIRTPINSIISLNDAILEEEKDSEVLLHSRIVKDSAGELLLLVNDILDISRIEAGRFHRVTGPMRFSECAAGAQASCRDRARSVGLTIDASGVDDNGEILIGDQPRIESVLKNLINFFIAGYRNEQAISRGSMKGNGTILVSSSPAEKGLYVSVESGDIKVKNSGVLGDRDVYTLAAQMILEIMGSKLVEYNDDAGKTSGFSFILDLPKSEDNGKAGDDAKQELKDIKILTVDDNSVNRVMFSRMLEKTGADVRVAASGQEALDAVNEEEFDVILMDVKMPGMSGTEAMREIRARKQIPVIAFTAENDPVEQEKLLGEGFNACLSKPVEPDVLYAAISRQLSRKV
ncbi:MAG: response regulator [Lachnospiraceae bacterium]|nr:response regulator [Lachnospiraceae bacterium]